VTALGNWLFTRTVNLLHGGQYTDCMVIFRVFRRSLVEELDLHREESYRLVERLFRTVVSWEPLMSVRAAKRRKRIAKCPSTSLDAWGPAEAADHPLGCCVLFSVLA
jgi:hypothetical protein